MIFPKIFTFYKTSYLNEEVNCTDPSLLVSAPWENIIAPNTI
jgi:hypothetical protein